VIGVSMISARRLGHETAHAGQLPDLLRRAAGARVRHHEIGLNDGMRPHLSLGVRDLLRAELAQHLVGDAVGHLGPDVDHLLLPFAVGDEAFVCTGPRSRAPRRWPPRGASVSRRGMTMSLMPIEMPAFGRLLVAEVLQAIGEDHRRLVARVAVRKIDQRPELLLSSSPCSLRRRGSRAGRSRRGAHGPTVRLDDLTVTTRPWRDTHADPRLEIPISV